MEVLVAHKQLAGRFYLRTLGTFATNDQSKTEFSFVGES